MENFPKIFIVHKFPLLKLKAFAFSRKSNFISFLQLSFLYSLYAYSSIPKDIFKSPKQILKKMDSSVIHEWGDSYDLKKKHINCCSVAQSFQKEFWHNLVKEIRMFPRTHLIHCWVNIRRSTGLKFTVLSYIQMIPCTFPGKEKWKAMEELTSKWVGDE